ALDGHADRIDLLEDIGVVRLRVDRLGQILADLVLVDVEGRDELDVADVVAAEVDVHQARDGVGRLRVLVVVAALDEAARAVADADDRDADLLAGPAAVGGRSAVRAVGAHGWWSPPGLSISSGGDCRMTWTIRWMVVMVARMVMRASETANAGRPAHQ